MSNLSTFYPVGQGGVIETGGGLTWSKISTDTTGVDGEGYIIDTVGGGVEFTLPNSPTEGQQTAVRDYAGTFDTFPVTVKGNGARIEGQLLDMTLDTKNYACTLVYTDSTRGWVLVTSTPLNTIQGKPMMHVQDQKAQGTAPQTLTAGSNVLQLNTAVTNEIAGSSLSSYQVTLPAGEYWLDGWGIACRSGSAGRMRLEITDASDDSILLHGSNTSDYDNVFISGRLNLTTSTTIEFIQRSAASITAQGRAVNLDTYEIYGDLRIWRLDFDKVYPSVDEPSVALSKPLLHIQDQKTTGTAGGSNTNGDNDRDLNTVIVNEISGASLSSNLVTLAAGKYFVSGSSYATADGSGGRARQYVSTSTGTKLLVGIPVETSGTTGAEVPVSGYITLTESTQIKMVTHFNDAASDGKGTATGQAPYEVYSDLKIWKIDALAQTPIVYQPTNQPVTGAYVTGGIFGGEIEWTSTLSLNVKAFSCMDDTLTTELVMENDWSYTWTGPLAGSTIYHVFGVYSTTFVDVLWMIDTDINGANLTDITAKRWLGFFRTDPFGFIDKFVMSGDTWVFENPARGYLMTGLLNTQTYSIDISTLVPKPRVREVLYAAHATVVSRWIGLKDATLSYTQWIPATTTSADWNSASSNAGYSNWMPRDAYPFCTYGAGTGTGNLILHGVKLYR